MVPKYREIVTIEITLLRWQLRQGSIPTFKWMKNETLRVRRDNFCSFRQSWKWNRAYGTHVLYSLISRRDIEPEAVVVVAAVNRERIARVHGDRRGGVVHGLHPMITPLKQTAKITLD